MHDPVSLLFGGMEKLGPGSDADTLHVLRLVPQRDFRRVVDAGCGTGRQTLALARALGCRVHAIDSHAPFLNDLAQRARAAKLEHLIESRCMDMKDIAHVFDGIELLWCEGAAYNIGFENALRVWKPALMARGYVVLSELAWLTEQAPHEAKEFFAAAYPDMRSLEQNVDVAEGAGYSVLATHTLAPSAWLAGYYDVLRPRAERLLDHSDAAVRSLSAETVKEIEVFECSKGSYGYVFYLLQAS